jgi:PAS domain S-box-containing protein
MKDENRTKSNLIRELKSLRRRNKRLEIAESKEKKLEKILSESETKYRSLFENSLDAILLTSPDGKILSANPAACHMYGRTEKELCKAGRKELVDLQDPHVAELLKKISRTGKASGEFYQNRKDGTCFLTEVISAVFDAPDGKRTSMIIRDISKRKQAEDALRESEARYKSLFENSIMGISQASPDGRLIYANTPYAQMYGYKNPEEMITLVSDVGQLYANPEAREEVLHILKEKGVMGLREMAVKRRDGSRFFVLVNAREIKDSKGNLLYYQAEHLDITERKRVEEKLIEDESRLSALFDNAGYSISLAKNGVLILGNPAFVKLFGYKDTSEFLGKSFINTIAPKERERIWKYAADREMCGEVPNYYETKGFRRDGSIFDMNVRVSRYIYNNEIYIVGFQSDITERKRVEVSLQNSEAALREAQRVARIGSWHWDAKSDAIWWSDELYRIYEKDPGIPPSTFEKDQKNYTPESAAQLTASVQKALKTGEPYEIDLELVHNTEPRRWVIARGEVIRNASSQITGLRGTVQDITERKRVEEELHESEEKYRYMFANNPQPMWIYDLETLAFLEINSAALQHYGYSREEFLSMTLKDIRPQEDIDALLKDVELTTKEYNRAGEWRHLKKSGEIINVEIISHIVTFKDRKARHVMVNDITERKQAEEALRASEARYRHLFDASPDGIVVIAFDGSIKSANIAQARMYRYDSPHDLIGVHATELVAISSRDYSAQILQRRLNGEDIPPVEYELVRKDGTTFFGETSATILQGADGTVSGYICTTRDTTERNRIQEALHMSSLYTRSLIEVSLDPLITISTNGKVMDVNKATEFVTGVSREQLIGSDFSDYFTEPEKAREGYRNVFKDGSIRDYALAIRHKSGQVTEVLYNAAIFSNDAGDVQGVFAAARDITEHKRVEAELRIFHNELRMLANHLQNIREEERMRLAREFHDQLGQSLTALKMDLSLLLRMISDEKQDVQRNLVADELRSMQKLVDETINMIWVIIAGLRPQMLEDLGLVTTLEWEAKQFESRTGISCELKSSAGDIQMDSNKSIALFRIYQEALTNVARHANATVVKSVLKREHEMLVLEIKDNGCGISIDRKSKPESFGLIGMRERALALGGSCEISGSPGEGTTVLVRLPLEQNDEQESTSK